jgi:hypothetical protein
VINFTEGTVLIDDQPLATKAGTFASVPQGSTLRTEQGRAEILLMPGVFLRVDEHSSIRMLSNALDNTRVEFLNGAVILDSNEAKAPRGAVTLIFKGFEIGFLKNGVYRIDSDPAVLETYVGEAEVHAAGLPPKKIDESRQFFFAIGMDTNKYGDGAIDTFSEWARNRAETIAADNRAAAQSTADPTLPDPSLVGPLPPIYPSYTPTPLYPVSNPGVFGSTVVLDNGFANAFGPVTNLFPANPFTVIYVFPRLHAGGHSNQPGSGIPPRKSTGYPVLSPTRITSPNPSPHRPMPLTYGTLPPLRGYGPARIYSPVFRPPVPGINVPHVGAPSLVNRPMMMGPHVMSPRPVSPAVSARPNAIAPVRAH